MSLKCPDQRDVFLFSEDFYTLVCVAGTTDSLLIGDVSLSQGTLIEGFRCYILYMIFIDIFNSFWSPSFRLLLVKEVVSLMYLISVYDPFFDTHLKQCEYWYVFVLNRLSYLFSTAKGEEVDEGTLPIIL